MKARKATTKTSGRCVLAVEDKNGDFYQVNLKEENMGFIIMMAQTLFKKGVLEVLPDKLPITLEKRDVE